MAGDVVEDGRGSTDQLVGDGADLSRSPGGGECLEVGRQVRQRCRLVRQWVAGQEVFGVAAGHAVEVGNLCGGAGVRFCELHQRGVVRWLDAVVVHGAVGDVGEVDTVGQGDVGSRFGAFQVGDLRMGVVEIAGVQGEVQGAVLSDGEAPQGRCWLGCW